MASSLSASEAASRAGTALDNWSKEDRRTTRSAASGAFRRSSKAVRVALERSDEALKDAAFALSLSIQAAEDEAANILEAVDGFMLLSMFVVVFIERPTIWRTFYQLL